MSSVGSNVSTVRMPQVTAAAKLVCEDFKAMMEAVKPGEKVESKRFLLKDHEFSILVFPNGWVDAAKDHVSVYLMNHSDVDVMVKMEFTVGSKKWMDSVTVKSKDGRCWPKYLHHDEVQSELRDGSLVITAQVSMAGEIVMDGPDPTQGQTGIAGEPASTSHRILEEMRNADFLLVCEDGTIPCHQLFLGAASPVFRAQIDTKMKEGEERKVEMEYSANVMRGFISFVYTGEIEEELLKQEVEVFLELGEKYDVKKLKNLAEKKMCEILNEENMVTFFLMGDIYGAPRIRMEAKNYLRQKVRILKEKENWQELFGGRTDLIVELLVELLEV